MSNNGIFLPKDIDVNDFEYTKPFPNQSKTITSIYMNLNRTRPKIQSPMLYCPFGLNVYRDEKKPNKDPTFDLELQLDDSSESAVQFREWLEALETRVLKDMKSNSKAWMNRAKLSDRMAKEKFKPLVKRYFDKETLEFSDKYPPRVRVKMPRKNGHFDVRVFNNKREVIDLDAMPIEELDGYAKGCRICVIFRVGGIWSGAKGFGVTLKAHQMMIFPIERLTGFGFVEDVEDELIFGAMTTASGDDPMDVEQDEDGDEEPLEDEEPEENSDEVEVEEEEGEDEPEPISDEEEEEVEAEQSSEERGTKRKKQSSLAKYSSKKSKK